MSSGFIKQKSRDSKRKTAGKKKTNKEAFFPDAPHMTLTSRDHPPRHSRKKAEAFEKKRSGHHANKKRIEDVSHARLLEAEEEEEKKKNVMHPDTLVKMDATDDDIPLTEEQKAFFNSVMVKEGLHPAYVLGLHAPSPSLVKVLKEKGATEETLHETVSLAQKIFKPFIHSRDILDALQTLEEETVEKPEKDLPQPEGQNMEYLFNNEPVRWPQIPRHTVPGFVFTGATFAKTNHTKPKYASRPPHDILANLTKNVTEFLATWWNW